MTLQYHSPGFETIYKTLSYYANHTPNNLAIIASGRQSLNFKELKELVDELSTSLNTTYYKDNRRIAIIMPNGPEMALAFLAISSFATAAPLDPQYQASDLEFYLSDLNADGLLIHSEIDSSARNIAKMLNIPVFEAVFDTNKPAGVFTISSQTKFVLSGKLPSFSQAKDIALLLHTSGTTSRPKLVPLSQQNLCSSAGNIVKTLNLSETDRCLNITPLFHIHGLIAALLASITAGGSVVCSSGLDTNYFFAWLLDLKPTWYTGVPTMHQAILSTICSNFTSKKSHSLRFIRSASSALAPQIMSSLEKTFHVPVIEAYGMTEAANQIASNPLPPGLRKPGSVGQPTGQQVTILDQAGNILTNNQPGEIAIRGLNVTAGYESNLEANRVAFVNGWFRTGDLGYIDETGYLFINARQKEIINRGGEKISPREVDEALLDHPEIIQAIVFSASHPSLGEDLVAAVVLQEKSQLDAHNIRHFLFKKLPGYKVPSQVLIIDEIPKGSTGKVQRIGLFEKLAKHFEQAYAKPRTKLEIILAKLYSELLKLPKVGIQDNFFALGGDSLLATQLINRLNGILSIDIPIITVFQAPTVSELAIDISKYQAKQVDSKSMQDIQTTIEEFSNGETVTIQKITRK